MFRKLLLTLLVAFASLWLWRMQARLQKRERQVNGKKTSKGFFGKNKNVKPDDTPLALVACEKCGVYFSPAAPLKDGVKHSCNNCINH